MKKNITENHWLRKRPIAHRGLHNIANGIPENSLAAFEEACSHNFPLELDVRVTKDDKAIVFHDSNLLRLTGKNERVSNLTSDELTQLKLSKTEEHIPLLTDVLKLVNGRVPILIEIKRHFLPGKLEDAVIDALKDYKGEFAILSFNPFAIHQINHKAPEFIVGINIGRIEKPFFRTVMFNKFINSYSLPQFVSYSMNGSIPEYSSEYYKKIHLPILAWTVTSKNAELKARRFADNIIFERYIPE